MADLSITIPTPVLVAGQAFRVRYRVHPAGSWTTLTPDKTNATFTITGLSPDTYDISFMLVKFEGSPAVETGCDEAIRTVTLTDEIGCIEASGEITLIDQNLYILTVTYTGTPTACFYELIYGIAGQTQSTITYATLPASPIILPASNNQYTIEIRAYTCDGLYTVCYEDTIDPPEGGCEHSTITTAELIFYNGGIYIHLVIAQSVPMTSMFYVSYYQSNMVNTGIPDPGGTFPYAGTPTTTILYIPVTPNFDIVLTNGDQILKYAGSFTDACGYTNKFNIDLEIS